jgi:type I restriction enzyme, S subunit
MASEWASRTIESLCVRVTSGGTPRTGVTAYYDGGLIPWVTTKEVNFGPIWSTETCITERGMAESSAKLMPADTVIVAMYGRGTAGRVAYARVALATNQACCNLVVDPTEAHPRFVYYALWAAQARLDALANGSVQQNLSASLIREFRIGVPPLVEQSAIARILGALDDKIELNRRTNETLEAIARTLFKSWFVDFDPVRSKSEGRDPGLPPQLGDLFPDSFEDSELGEIPAGWMARPIYDIADFVYGAAFASARFNTEGVGRQLIRIRDLATEWPGVWTPETHPKGHVVWPGDVVVGMDGEFRAYVWGGPEAWLNQRLCVAIPKPGYSAAFVRSSLTEPLRQVEATETATTVIHLGKFDIDRFVIVVPTRTVAEAFGRICQVTYDRIVARSGNHARSLPCATPCCLGSYPARCA